MLHTTDLLSDSLSARLGSTPLGNCVVPVRVQRGPRVCLGRDFLKEEDRLVAGDSVLTPWHAAALCGPEARVVTRVADGRLRIGIVVPELANRPFPSWREDPLATLDLFVAEPRLADRLRWRSWRRLRGAEPVACGQPLTAPAGSLESAFVQRETQGVLDDLVRRDRGLLAPASALSPWRRFVRLPLHWLALVGPSSPDPESESAFWFEVDWPERTAVEIACDVVLCTDLVLAKAVAVRSTGARLGIDKCSDLRTNHTVRILALWNSETGEVLEPGAMPWVPASVRYRVTAETPRANEAMVVEVPKPGLYTMLLAGSAPVELAAGTPLAVHRGSDRLLGGTLLEPTLPLAVVEERGLWSGLVAGILGSGALLRPVDFVQAIRSFQPFGVGDWSDAGATGFRSEARLVAGVLREVIVLSVPIRRADVASDRDLLDARLALAAHLQESVGRPVLVDVQWGESA